MMRLSQILRPMVRLSDQEARADKARSAMGRDTRKRNT